MHIRRKIIILLIFAFLFTGAGCQVDKTVKIGFSANLSGRNSILGVTARNGLEIAVEEINKAGGINGKKVELIIKDDEADPRIAAKVDKELLNSGVSAIIGHMLSSTVTASLDIINSSNILMLSPTISTESLTAQDDNIIRLIASNKHQGERLAEFAISKHGIRNFAALHEYNNKAYSEELYMYFREAVAENDGQVLYANSFASGKNPNLAVLAEDISKLDVEGVLVVAGGMDTAILYQHLQKLKPGIKIYCGVWSMTEDLITNGTNNMENLYVVGTYDKESSRMEFEHFRKRYIEVYNTEPTFASVHCYEALYVLKESMEEAEASNSQDIKSSLLKIRKFRGLMQDFEIDQYGDAVRPYFIFTVANNDFKRVD
ncbi:MAG: ABC transporter substrate-binding protein [Bacillota bacterium]